MPARKTTAFSHLSPSGEARMVNVAAKPEQRRRATAEGFVRCQKSTIALLKKQALPKGDVFAVARVAGIQAAKLTSTLIPLCHVLPLHHADVRFDVKPEGILLRVSAETTAKTGVEMEALTGVSVAALTIYDMCKAVDKTMTIENIRLVEKIKA